MGDQVPAGREAVVLRIVPVHRLVHALDKIGERLGLADIRLAFEKGLQIRDGLQHLGVFDPVLSLGLHEKLKRICTPKGGVEDAIVDPHCAGRLFIELEVVVNAQEQSAGPDGQQQCNSPAEKPARPAADQLGCQALQEAIQHAGLLLPQSFAHPGRPEEGPERRDEAHLQEHGGQHATAGANAEVLHHRNSSARQREESKRRDQPRGDHHRSDTDHGFHHRPPVGVPGGQAFRAQAVVLLVVALQDLNRMPRGHGENENGRSSRKGIEVYFQ